MLDSMVAASTLESTTMGIDTTITSTDDETTTMQISTLEDTSTDHDDTAISTPEAQIATSRVTDTPIQIQPLSTAPSIVTMARADDSDITTPSGANTHLGIILNIEKPSLVPRPIPNFSVFHIDKQCCDSYGHFSL